MKTVLNWIQAIGVVILLVAMVYAIWLTAIILTLAVLVYVIKELIADSL